VPLSTVKSLQEIKIMPSLFFTTAVNQTNIVFMLVAIIAGCRMWSYKITKHFGVNNKPRLAAFPAYWLRFWRALVVAMVTILKKPISV